jgi:hypothetical protein
MHSLTGVTHTHLKCVWGGYPYWVGVGHLGGAVSFGGELGAPLHSVDRHAFTTGHHLGQSSLSLRVYDFVHFGLSTLGELSSLYPK